MRDGQPDTNAIRALIESARQDIARQAVDYDPVLDLSIYEDVLAALTRAENERDHWCNMAGRRGIKAAQLRAERDAATQVAIMYGGDAAKSDMAELTAAALVSGQEPPTLAEGPTNE